MKETIRTLLESKMRYFMRIAFGAWLYLLVTGILAAFLEKEGKNIHWISYLLIIPGFAIFFITILRMQLSGIKCPECGVNLFGLCWYPRSKFRIKFLFSFPAEFRYCPGCAKELDEGMSKKV